MARCRGRTIAQAVARPADEAVGETADRRPGSGTAPCRWPGTDSGNPPGLVQKTHRAMMIRAELDRTLSTSGGRSSSEANRQGVWWMPAPQKKTSRTGTVTTSMASHHMCQFWMEVPRTFSRTTKRRKKEMVTEMAESSPKNSRVNRRRWSRTRRVRPPSSRRILPTARRRELRAPWLSLLISLLMGPLMLVSNHRES